MCLRPTWSRLIRGDTKPKLPPITFSGTHAQKKLLSWLKKNSAGVKSSWKTIDGMKVVLKTEKVAKKKAEKEAKKVCCPAMLLFLVKIDLWLLHVVSLCMRWQE